MQGRVELRDADRDEPQDVIPAQLAARRARWGFVIVLGAWVGFDAVVGLLVRSNDISARCTSYSMGAGAIGCFLVFPIWFGMSSRARLVVSGGQSFVVGRTLTGTRAVDLHELASARRFQALGRNAQVWDELRLRDRHGVRLSVDRVGGLEKAVQAAIEARGLSVSKGVKEKVGMRQAQAAGGRALLGAFILIGCLAGSVAASYFATSLIAGR